MNHRKDNKERRSFKRFRAKEGAFAVLRPQCTKLGQIVDISEGQKNYIISITSDDQTSTKSLSHTTFDFGTGGTCIIEINNGATVTADAGSICGILEATTEGITITVDTDGNVDPPLAYSTPWAEDFCDYECDCCE